MPGCEAMEGGTHRRCGWYCDDAGTRVEGTPQGPAFRYAVLSQCTALQSSVSYKMLRVARAWRRVGSTEQVLFGGVRSVHSSGWTGAAAGAGDQRASSEDNAFVKARRAYQAELHELRKTFKQDVAQAQTNRQQKTDAARKAHNERIWSEKALRDAEKAKRAAENVAAQQEMMLQKVRPRGTRFHLISQRL